MAESKNESNGEAADAPGGAGVGGNTGGGVEDNMLVYDGMTLPNGRVISDVRPHGYGIVTSETDSYREEPVSTKVSFNRDLVGFVGRLQYACTPIDRGIVFCGPDGSGRRSLATALAAYMGLRIDVIDFSRHLSKWMGETEGGVLKRMKENADKGRISLLVGMPDNDESGSVMWSVISSVYGAINDKPLRWIVANNPPSKLSKYLVINLGYGTQAEVREWCQYYFNDPHLASQLSRLRILPSMLSHLTCTSDRVVSEVKRAVIGNELAPKRGELLLSGWVDYFMSVLPRLRIPYHEQLRGLVSQSTNPRERARNEGGQPGALFHGTAGSGKSYTFHALAEAGIMRTGTTIAALKEAKMMWELYSYDAPMYLLFYDECNQMFAEDVPGSQREEFLKLIGSVDSPKNVFIVATTNMPLDTVSPAIWRMERLRPIHLGEVTREEFDSYDTGLNWIEGISFASLLALAAKPTLRDRAIELFSSLDLQYIEKTLSSEEVVERVALMPTALRAKATEIYNRVIEGESPIVRVSLALADALSTIFDIKLKGVLCLKRLSAYEMLGVVPTSLVVIQQENVSEVSTIPYGCCLCIVHTPIIDYT